MKISENNSNESQKEGSQLLAILDTRKLSEQKQYKVESEESILHFQPAFDLANDVLWDLNMMTNHLYLSPNAFKMFKISQPSVLNTEEIWNSIVHEKDKSRLINEFNPIINGQTDLFNFESRINLDTNEIQWISVKGKVVSRATDGSLNRLIGTCTDNTSIKLIDEELKRKHKQFKSCFEYSPIGLAINTFSDSWIELNQELCQMLGYKKEEILNKSWTEVMHSDDIQPTLKLIKDAIEGRIDCFKINSRLVRKNGELLYATLSCVCVRNDDWSHHFLTTVMNNTEHYKIEESDKLKTALLRNISHEIRTPLNAILGFSALLRESFLNNAEVLSYVETIQQSSYQLLSIINDLIDIASIEANIVKKQKSTVNLNELLRDIQNQFRFEASSKNLTLKLTKELSNDKAKIYTDKTKLVQIICNLLSNALKFTNTGQVSFGYTYNDSFLEFYVSDTGIGIELKYHTKIFETFFQIENELSKRFEGTGLGLSICKAYVKLLGGEIWLTSKYNEGSTFFFTIPYEIGDKHIN